MTITSNTRYIKVATKAFPLSLDFIRSENLSFSIPTPPTLEMVQELGYEPIHPTTEPIGDVVTEIEPVKNEDGEYQQTFSVRAFTTAELQQRLDVTKTELLAVIDTLTIEALAKGLPVDFGGDDGIQHIQLRDTDRVNLVALHVQATMAVAAGVDPGIFGFRTLENNWVETTPAQMLKLTMDASSGYSHIMQKKWHFQGQLAAVIVGGALPALPESMEPDTVSLPD